MQPGSRPALNDRPPTDFNGSSASWALISVVPAAIAAFLNTLERVACAHRSRFISNRTNFTIHALIPEIIISDCSHSGWSFTPINNCSQTPPAGPTAGGKSPQRGHNLIKDSVSRIEIRVKSSLSCSAARWWCTHQHGLCAHPVTWISNISALIVCIFITSLRAEEILAFPLAATARRRPEEGMLLYSSSTTS